MIDVKHLSKSFGEVEVLKDINETIEKGEKVVIVGPSGSGKSTFLRCLNLMEKPTSGRLVPKPSTTLTSRIFFSATAWETSLQELLSPSMAETSQRLSSVEQAAAWRVFLLCSPLLTA